ncbi:hypothetical protein G9A89_010270 [Geosiphon pyriformis]|nr:hypothetical protein G9A89_010270 [Geosiphon pyriformis]
MSHKKPKKFVASINIVDLSTGLLNLVDIDVSGGKSVVSWNSKVGSVNNNVNRLSDVEDIANIVAKETSYAESDKDNNMNNTMLRKICTWTYVLDNSPKQSVFGHMNKDNEKLELSLHVIQKALVKFELSNVTSLVASKWLVFIEKDSVHMALAINNKKS